MLRCCSGDDTLRWLLEQKRWGSRSDFVFLNIVFCAYLFACFGFKAMHRLEGNCVLFFLK
jgi:hypothetical protein